MTEQEYAERRLAPMLAAYVECAIWASPTEDGEPLDGSFGLDDLTDEARAKMASDLADFLRLCHEEAVDLSDLDAEQVGHDFWLTRNRHGAGFWDRGLGERGETLTKIAHSFGEAYLYLADDGTLDLI